MKTFITDNFLLQNNIAERLYHEYAKNMPIIDYHCHLPTDEIAQNRNYRSITEIWLDKDHYKWRAIRSAGYSEKEITGNIDNIQFDKSRFMTWATVVPQLLGNPLYHWTHLELLRYFNIDDLLIPETAEKIYYKANKIIIENDFTAPYLIEKFNLKFIGTTDDPIDSLSFHEIIKTSPLKCKISPSWRPDKIMKIESIGFLEYINQLALVTDTIIDTLQDFEKAILLRLDYFHDHNCMISDHGLDEFVFTKEFSEKSVGNIFKKVLTGLKLTPQEIKEYKSYILVYMGQYYATRNWVMQLHIGVLRNNNTKMFNLLGPDMGFDSINDKNYASELSSFLDTLNTMDKLPKTILYSLNPHDNEMLGTMIGNFQGDIPGKLQVGSGWWFNDQKDGMEKQMISLANLGLLTQFVGMLTDSRSFLSFSRHEYFRRILCNIIGKWVVEGQAPNDLLYLGSIVQNICFNNAKKYFNIN